MYVHLIKTHFLVLSNANICFFLLYIFNTSKTVETNCALWVVSGYIYTGQASMNMDISMDIHAKSVDMDMDVDGKFHIHDNPGNASVAPGISLPRFYEICSMCRLFHVALDFKIWMYFLKGLQSRPKGILS